MKIIYYEITIWILKILTVPIRQLLLTLILEVCLAILLDRWKHVQNKHFSLQVLKNFPRNYFAYNDVSTRGDVQLSWCLIKVNNVIRLCLFAERITKRIHRVTLYKMGKKIRIKQSRH